MFIAHWFYLCPKWAWSFTWKNKTSGSKWINPREKKKPKAIVSTSFLQCA